MISAGYLHPMVVYGKCMRRVEGFSLRLAFLGQLKYPITATGTAVLPSVDGAHTTTMGSARVAESMNVMYYGCTFEHVSY